jgi:general L-amino acid transport system substrate-binding protein
MRLAVCIVPLAVALLPQPAPAGEVFDHVRRSGVVRCGVSEGLIGFSLKDPAGRWSGMDVDFCRAVAAAALGDANKVVFLPLFASARFPALLSGEIDLLARNTTWTLGREAILGVLFAGTLYYDGEGFMVPRKSKVRRIADLNGATICVKKGTTHVENLADYFQVRGLKYKSLIMESLPELTSALLAGRCRACTSDMSQLAAIRMETPNGPDTFVILPDVISKEPLGPAVKWGDDEWFTLVRCVLFALVEAEEHGITSANVRATKDATTEEIVQDFLGKTSGLAKSLGIRPDWAIRVVESVGNYGEMFERNLGRQSPLKIERGLNRLWTKGGLMYAPPFR